MKFKELQDKDKAYIQVIHANSDLGWDERMSMLMRKFKVSKRTIRKWISQLGFSKHKSIENQEIREGKKRSYDSKKQTYIISWAQNATPVHDMLWNNMKAYAKKLDANIGIIQGRYQNPTSIWTTNMQNEEWWDDAFTSYKEHSDGSLKFTDKRTGKDIPKGEENRVEYVSKQSHKTTETKSKITKKEKESGKWSEKYKYVKEKIIDFSYLDAGRHRVHEYLEILSDVKVRPTAVNPLTGFEGISGPRSSIFGHPRMHLKSLPVLKGHAHKMLLTTGACTVRNYTDTKAGKKAEFHHVYGFCIVEIEDDETFHIRQVSAQSDGSFIDLYSKVSNGKITKIKKCPAFVMGDSHVGDHEEYIMDACINDLFKKIRPARLIAHDIYTGETVNHHQKKDPIHQYLLYKKGKNLVSDETKRIFEFIDKYKLTDYNLTIVRSNHDMWLDRWVRENKWRDDPANALTYMKYAQILLEEKAPKGLIPYLLDEHYEDKITTLELDESLKVMGYELGQHGHLGANGSRGGITQLRKLSTKIIVGDAHTPGRLDGVLVAGTFTKLNLDYNHGPSSWMHCGVMIHENSKAQHIFFSHKGTYTIQK